MYSVEFLLNEGKIVVKEDGQTTLEKDTNAFRTEQITELLTPLVGKRVGMNRTDHRVHKYSNGDLVEEDGNIVLKHEKGDCVDLEDYFPVDEIVTGRYKKNSWEKVEITELND